MFCNKHWEILYRACFLKINKEIYILKRFFTLENKIFASLYKTNKEKGTFLYETSWGPTAETGFVGTHVEVWQYPWDLEKLLHVLSPQKRSSMHFTQSAPCAPRDTLFECFVKNVEVVLQCPWHLKKEIFPRTFFFTLKTFLCTHVGHGQLWRLGQCAEMLRK